MIVAIILVVLFVLYLLSLRGRRNAPGWEGLLGWKYAHRGLHDEKKPENSLAAFRAARAACAALRDQCDVCVCIYHGGFEEDLATGQLLSDSGENIACKIARDLDFDLLLTEGIGQIYEDGAKYVDEKTIRSGWQNIFSMDGSVIYNE